MKSRAQYNRQAQERYQEKGLCAQCGKRPKQGAFQVCGLCLERTRAHGKAYRIRLRTEVYAAYGGPRCVCCGETYLEFLTLDHVNGGGTKHRAIVGTGDKLHRWLRKHGFPAGFRVLCFNCNYAVFRYVVCPHQRSENAMPRMPVTEISKKVAALEARLNRKPDVKGARVCTDVELAPNTYFLRRPCGIVPLDVHTGGGLPAGGLTYLSGPDGAGKTFLLYKYMAMCQKLYGEKAALALGVSEAAPDHFFMRKCGIQIAVPEQMIAEQVAERKERGEAPFSKEQLKSFRAKTVGTVKLLRGANGEELLGAILECFETKCFDIIGLDSISAVLPEADAGKDLDETAKRAAAANMITRFFQHYLNGTTGYYGTNPTTVIFTAQVRSNAKKAEGGPMAKWLLDYAPVGAWAAKHGKLIDILVKPGAKDKEPVASSAPAPTSLADAAERQKYVKRVQVGKTVNYEVLKGKAGIHEGITGEFEFHFAANQAAMRDPNHRLTEDERMVVVAALQVGIAEEKDGMVTFCHPVTNEPLVHNDLVLKNIAGIDRLAQLMRDDFELDLVMRRSLLSAIGVECAYR